jgi:hypothetical protein
LLVKLPRVAEGITLVSTPEPKISGTLRVEGVLFLLQQVVEQPHVGAAAAEEVRQHLGRQVLAAGFPTFQVDEQGGALGRKLGGVVEPAAEPVDQGMDAHDCLLRRCAQVSTGICVDLIQVKYGG